MVRHHLMGRSLAGALVIVAASVPSAAQAQSALQPVSAIGAPALSTSAPASPVSRPARTPAAGGPGFQWGDAGIGAAGAVAVLGAGAIACAAPRRRRAQHRIAG
jgi:hypothetical protein